MDLRVQVSGLCFVSSQWNKSFSFHLLGNFFNLFLYILHGTSGLGELSLDEVELIPFMTRPSDELHHDNSSVMNYHLLKYLHIRIPFHSLQDKLTLSCHLNSQQTVHHIAPRGFYYKLQIASCFLLIVRICLNSTSSQFTIGHGEPQRTS